MIGRVLSRFRILEQIGAGAMGVVYRARDLRLERDVALKVLPAGMLGDEHARRRFRREALALSKLNHPNVATVHDFDSHDGVDFLVLEYIAGQSLEDRIAAEPLNERDVCRWGAQLARGLEAAHQQGVVHRDLKPANIRLTSDGRLKILDFGLARLLRPVSERASLASLTAPHEVLGTLAYMSPEQLSGQEVDVRSDLYAAGVVLYEMATGRRPFGNVPAAQLMFAVLNQAPDPPTTIRPASSRALDTIVLRALEKDPDLRYQSARELYVDLERMSVPVTSAPRPIEHDRVRRALAISAPLVLVTIALLLLRGDCRDRLLHRVPSERISSLAVLPLANLSRDPDQEYFADGLTDELITKLTQIGALRVIATSSVQGFRNTAISAPEIAKRLNVGAFVVGSVLQSGNRVRINARLVEAHDGRQLWAESYERDLRDVLGLQNEVTLAIVRGIQARLTPGEEQRLTHRGTVDPIAYQDYLRGRFHLKRFTEEDFETAHRLFLRAISRDPTYAPAYAGIADRYYEASSVWMPPREAIPRARAAALRALELDSTLAEAHTSLATVLAVYDWDWEGAEREFRRAVELNPGYALAHQRYGHVLSISGRHAESIDQASRAVEIDPLSPFTRTFLALAYYFSRRENDAVREFQKTIAMDTTFYLPRVFYGLTLAQAGHPVEAIAQMEIATRLDDNLQGLAQKGWVYARAGRRADALAVLDMIERREREKPTFYPHYDVAAIFGMLGDDEAAFRHLQRAYETRAEALSWIGADPRMDPLRGDPRFGTMLRRLKIAPQ